MYETPDEALVRQASEKAEDEVPEWEEIDQDDSALAD